MLKRSDMQHGVYYWGSTERIGVQTARWNEKRGCFVYNTSAWPEPGVMTMEMNHVENDDGCEIFTPTEVVTWGTDEIVLED